MCGVYVCSDGVLVHVCVCDGVYVCSDGVLVHVCVCDGVMCVWCM